MSYSYQPHTTSASQTTYTFSFAGVDPGYISVAHISVEVRNSGDSEFATLDSSKWYLSGTNQITLTPAIAEPADGKNNLRIRRIVPKETPYATFPRGSMLDMLNLDRTFIQTLEAFQEFLDGFLPAGFYFQQNINMNGHKFTNLGAGTASGDSINWDQWDNHEQRIVALETDLTALSSRTIPYYYIATGGETRWEGLPWKFNSALMFIDGVFQNQNLGAFSITDNGFNFAEPLIQGQEVYVLLGSTVADPSSSPTYSELAAYDGLKFIGKCPSVSALRATEPSFTGQKIDVGSYYSGGKTGGGYYTYDSTDTTSADDGMTCIVTPGGKRWKPVLSGRELPATRSGLDTGSDATALWKLWCATGFDKKLDCNVYVSGVGKMADNTHMYGSAQCGIHLTASVSDQVSEGQEGSCLEAGDRSNIVGVRFYGHNFNGAGVFIGGKTGVVVTRCEMSDTYAIGVKNYKSVGSKIYKNHIHSCRHGVLSQQSNDTQLSYNHIHNISWTTGNNGGGAWTSADTNIIISGNIIHDCADVGVDFEGGNNCVSDNNLVARCRNGELTFFGTGTSIVGAPVMGRNVHKNNTVFRDNYALDKDGNSVPTALTDAAGCVVYGTLDLSQDGEIAFENNTVHSTATTGVSLFCFRSRTTSPNSNCKIAFRNNKFITNSGYMGTLLDRQDVVFEGNTLTYKGGTVRTIELRDHRTLKLRNNKVDIESGVVTGNNVFLLSTAISVVGKVIVAGNSFSGYDGVWVYIDQINSGRSVIIDNNDFGEDAGYTTLPVAIGTGGIIWKNTKLRLFRPTGAAINFAGVGAFYQSSFVSMDATAWLMRDGKIKCGYRFALKCDKNDTMYLSAIDAGGAASTGRFPDSTTWATFSGNTITFNSTGTPALSAVVELTLDSVPI